MSAQALRAVLNTSLLAWAVVEIAKFIRSRRQRSAEIRDRLSSPLFFVGIFLGISTAARIEPLRLAPLPGPLSAYLVAAILLVWCGIALRLWSFATLGTLFTFQVTIHPDHRVVTSGPYRYLRHPSYTGVFLLVAGYALIMRDALSLGVALAAAAAVIAYRIVVEERELDAALGDDYRDYARHTKRLIPGVF